jgi:glycosyltransferase involved in cell wall biosynthesis
MRKKWRYSTPRLTDVYICPTLEDNLPNTVLEALSCGTPVLASEVGGVPDMVANHRNGLLFKPDDAPAIANAIKWVVENQAVLPEWSIRARHGVEANYTLEIQAKRFIEIYSGLLKRRNARPSSLPPPSSERLPLVPATWNMPIPFKENFIDNA